jgi:hypothetical protein
MPIISTQNGWVCKGLFCASAPQQLVLPLLLCHCNCCCCKKETLKLRPSTIPRQFANQLMLLPVRSLSRRCACLTCRCCAACRGAASPTYWHAPPRQSACGERWRRRERQGLSPGVCGRRQVAPGRADLTRPKTATRASACTGSEAPSCRPATSAQAGRQGGQERYSLPNLPVPLLHNAAHHAACTAQSGGIYTAPPTSTPPTCCAAHPSPVPCWPWWQPG